MTKLLLALTAIACATPALAQSIYQGTITPYGGSIYSNQPDGYTLRFRQDGPIYQPPPAFTYQPRGCTSGLGQFTTYTC